MASVRHSAQSEVNSLTECLLNGDSYSGGLSFGDSQCSPNAHNSLVGIVSHILISSVQETLHFWPIKIYLNGLSNHLVTAYKGDQCSPKLLLAVISQQTIALYSLHHGTDRKPKRPKHNWGHWPSDANTQKAILGNCGLGRHWVSFSIGFLQPPSKQAICTLNTTEKLERWISQ